MAPNHPPKQRPAVADKVPSSSAGIRDVGAEEAALEVKRDLHTERVQRATVSFRTALAATVVGVCVALGLAVMEVRKSEVSAGEGWCVPAASSMAPASASVSKVTVLAANTSGSKILVAYTRAGRNVLVGYEAGKRHATLTHTLPKDLAPDAPREELLQLARALPGVDPKYPVDVAPKELLHCASGDTHQLAGRHSVPMTWETFAEPCEGGRTMAQWRMCSVQDPERCVTAPEVPVVCMHGAPRFVGAFEVGETLWVVAERPGLGGDTPRMMAGIAWDALVAPK